MSLTSSVSVCFIKCFLFSENISKQKNSLLQDIFQKPCLLTMLCFALKVSKTFHACLLALLCFYLKVYKKFS